MSDCLFCRIATGGMAAARVFEDETIVGFLDICPIRPGHLQIIPRAHYRYFDDLPAEVLTAIAQAGQRAARALKGLTGVDRVAFLFTGGDIPHAHAHVVPLHEATDITSRQYIADREVTFRSTPRVDASELAAMAERLRSELAVLDAGTR